MRPEPDRPVTSNERLLIALLLVLLVVLAGTCASCTAAQIRALTPATRSPAQQNQGSVAITVTCGKDTVQTGSGTIVRSGRVLTANHVVTCDPDAGDLSSVTIDPGDGNQYPASLDILLPGMDLAFLSAANLTHWYTPVTVGAVPETADRLCEAAANPRWTYRCGDVEWATPSLIRMSMFTEFGNSGAAVYDSDGRIVGVMISTLICQGKFQCVGGVRPIQALAWYIEE